MKIIQKGNVYRRAGWWKEHELEICECGCIVIGFFCLVLFALILGI